jgi:uncharacterized radical SAM superfamily protein
MKTKISQDIKYVGRICAFNCKECGSPLLMDGCNNENCNNYYAKNVHKEFEKIENQRAEAKVLREVPLEECGLYGKILAKRKVGYNGN